MRNSNFLVLPPLGVGVFGKLLAARKRKDRQRNRLGRSHDLAADRTAPEQVWQAPGLREFRLAESQQILPLTGNRKPASAVPADPTPSRGSPTGRRSAGDDYKTEANPGPPEDTHHGPRLQTGWYSGMQ